MSQTSVSRSTSTKKGCSGISTSTAATFLWWHYVPAARQQAMLVGNAVIVGMPDKDGNSTDVPEAAYRLLMQHARYAAPFIEVATPVSAVAKSDRSRAQRGATRKSDLAAIRSWANQNGYKVSDRGRVPAAVVEAYDAAH